MKDATSRHLDRKSLCDYELATRDSFELTCKARGIISNATYTGF